MPDTFRTKSTIILSTEQNLCCPLILYNYILYLFLEAVWGGKRTTTTASVTPLLSRSKTISQKKKLQNHKSSSGSWLSTTSRCQKYTYHTLLVEKGILSVLVQNMYWGKVNNTPGCLPPCITVCCNIRKWWKRRFVLIQYTIFHIKQALTLLLPH